MHKEMAKERFREEIPCFSPKMQNYFFPPIFFSASFIVVPDEVSPQVDHCQLLFLGSGNIRVGPANLENQVQGFPLKVREKERESGGKGGGGEIAW